MAKILIGLFVICSSFTVYWMSETNYGPFILRHPVPEKLRSTCQLLYSEELLGLGIESIRFGKYNAQRGDMASIEIEGLQPTIIHLPDSAIGPVLLSIKNKRLEVYWEIRDGLSYEQALSILSEQINYILDEYRRWQSIELTFQ